jgi:hypothetical protein
VLIQQPDLGLLWTGRRVGRWPLDYFRFGWRLSGTAFLAFQFGDSQVEPFNLLEGDQVYFTQQFDDLGLVGVGGGGMQWSTGRRIGLRAFCAFSGQKRLPPW